MFMHKLCTPSLSVIRFRRYSRKAYAVFCSLHRHVTIGHLACEIADRQLKKSNVACQIADYDCFDGGENPLETFPEEENFAFLQLSVVNVTTRNEVAAAAVAHLIVYSFLSYRFVCGR